MPLLFSTRFVGAHKITDHITISVSGWVNYGAILKCSHKILYRNIANCMPALSTTLSDIGVHFKPMLHLIQQ